jgi:hypothetical protein
MNMIHHLVNLLYSFNAHLLHFLPDSLFLKIQYRLKMGKRLNLDNPKTFNEKSQWLKLHDRKSEYTQIADKYAVRKYITNVLGEEYLIPICGVWDTFDEIEFEKLPNQFVIKCTHDSGSVIICRDKSTFDIKAARKKINKYLKNNFYYFGREWPYKNIKPRIIIEKYMVDESETELKDYKILCFNGIPDNIMVCIERASGTPQYYHFDFEWNFLRLNKWGVNAPKDFTLPKPKSLDKMKEIAQILSKNICLTRIDFYDIHGRLFFGEITFFPQSGFDNDFLPETDILFGKKIVLPMEEQLLQ